MSTAWTNFLFEGANFLVLAGALFWVLFKPVRATLESERERHSRLEAEIAERRAEAERLVEQNRQMHNEVEEEGEKRRASLVAEAEKQAAAIRQASRREQAAARARMEQEAEALVRRQVGMLAESIGRVAGESILRMLAKLDGPSLDVALVTEACTKLRALPEEARRAATVEVARPLQAGTRRLLEEVLGDGFQEQTDRQVGAGIRVTTSAGQVDASAAGIARHAAQELEARLAAPPRDHEPNHE